MGGEVRAMHGAVRMACGEMTEDAIDAWRRLVDVNLKLSMSRKLHINIK